VSRKQWLPFERLNAADLNTHVVDQTVMRFATAAARTAAIPSPTLNMVTARDDNAGILEIWNSAAWVSLSAGVAVPNVLVSGTPLTTGSVAVGPTVGTLDVWYEVTAGLGSNVLIHAISLQDAPSPLTVVEVGTGAAASEVTRFAMSDMTSLAEITRPAPFGVYVPAGTRIAIRSAVNAGALTARLHYSVVTTGTQYQAGVARVSGLANSTAWQQVAATTPIAQDIYIIGVSKGLQASPFRLGLGPAASEVAITGDVNPNGIGGMPVDIPAVVWTNGTRLALQYPSAPGGATDITVYWRAGLGI
jgi:hypothetical protein